MLEKVTQELGKQIFFFLSNSQKFTTDILYHTFKKFPKQVFIIPDIK